KKARTETDWSWLPSPVSADSPVDPANTGEKPDSCNRNLPGVEYPLGLAGESTVRVDSLPDSSARTSASTSPMCGFAGEGLLPGVPTWATDVSAGCWAPETSIKRCSADVLTWSCLEAAGTGS